VPGYVQISTLERALKIDRQKLRELNPALLRAVWDGQRHVPKSYHLRLPIDGEKWTNDLLAARLSPGDFYAAQPEPRRYRVRRGDTVANVADQFGVTAEALARLNRMRTSGRLKVGRVINLPESTAGSTGVAVLAGGPGGSNAAAVAATPTTVAANTPATGARSSTAAPGRLAAEGPAGTATASTPTTGPRRGIIASPSGVYVVQTGESLSDIASKFGMTEAQLLRLNGIRNRDFVYEGQQLLVTATPPSALASNVGPGNGIPSTTSSGTTVAKSVEGGATGAPLASTATPSTNVPSRERLTGATAQVDTSPVPVVAAGAVNAEEAARESVEEAQAVAKAEVPTENAQPVNAAQAEELSPALGPAADTQQSADPTDYSVAKDNTIRVAAAETLGHYADWLSVSAAKLRQLNKMSFAKPVLIGHKLKLDFGRVSREAFETKRREYHVELQATYFAEHRIIGTEVYIVRRGDALWTVTQRFDQMPIWLLQQYNPDVDLADLHPGTQIVMPRVETVVAGPG